MTPPCSYVLRTSPFLSPTQNCAIYDIHSPQHRELGLFFRIRLSGKLCKETKSSQISKDHSRSRIPPLPSLLSAKMCLFLETFTFQLQLPEDFYRFKKIFFMLEKKIIFIGNTFTWIKRKIIHTEKNLYTFCITSSTTYK